MGKRGRDQLSPTDFKEENFWKFNCLWMVGVGGRGKKNRTALWSDKKKFHRNTNKMLRFHPPSLIISCMTFSSQYYATKLIINDVYVVEPRFHISSKGLISRLRYITIGPQALIMYVVNLEINNSPKWVLFNIVIGQITSDALWK